MAKVLRYKGGGNAKFPAGDEGGYYVFFPESAATNGTTLVLNDSHADELLDKFSDKIEVVPTGDWSDQQKTKAAEYTASREEDARKQFPDLFGKVREIPEPVESTVAEAAVKPRGRPRLR